VTTLISAEEECLRAILKRQIKCNQNLQNGNKFATFHTNLMYVSEKAIPDLSKYILCIFSLFSAKIDKIVELYL